MFSAHSDKAIRYATTLAEWQSQTFVPNIPELLHDLINAAETHVAEQTKQLAALGLVIEKSVKTGRPSTAIVEEASAGRFDMIVTGTHGRTGLSQAFLGSVAQRVVQRAPCPVLTVRDTSPADANATTTATAAAV